LLLYVLGFGLMAILGALQSWQRQTPRRRYHGRPRPTPLILE
jgi:hypothetical protein